MATTQVKNELIDLAVAAWTEQGYGWAPFLIARKGKRYIVTPRDSHGGVSLQVWRGGHVVTNYLTCVPEPVTGSDAAEIAWKYR